MASSEVLARLLLQHALFDAVGSEPSAVDEGEPRKALPPEVQAFGEVLGSAARMEAGQRRIWRLKLARAFLLELDRGITSGELLGTDAESWGG